MTIGFGNQEASDALFSSSCLVQCKWFKRNNEGRYVPKSSLWRLGLHKEKRGENSWRTWKSRVTLTCCFQLNGCCHFEQKAWTSVSPQSHPLSGAIANHWPVCAGRSFSKTWFSWCCINWRGWDWHVLCICVLFLAFHMGCASSASSGKASSPSSGNASASSGNASSSPSFNVYMAWCKAKCQQWIQ